MKEIFSMELAGRKLTIETGQIAQLANGSILARYGDTVVLVTATASDEPREGIDFFPLSVDYEEKLYSIGKIPGSFMRREGKPSEHSILTSRVIDRQLRPLFPKDLRNDVSIIATVLSVEQDNSPEVTAMLGASVALAISDIPFNGPVAGVSVGLIDGKPIINPTSEQKSKSVMEVTVAATREKIIMIEAGADQVPEDVMLDSIMFAHETIKKLCDFIDEIASKVGKEKFEYESFKVDDELYEDIKQYAEDKVREALDTNDKKMRDKNLAVVYEDVFNNFEEKYPDMKLKIEEALYMLQREIVRKWIIDEGKRPDGRKMDEIRPLSAEVRLLPRVHGSGLFTRGQTQVLTIATLGALGDMQKIDGLDEEETKRYMHHYNFPSYSVGEARPARGPGRREIGHGALAERSLEPVIPSVEKFPYAIRLVSEVVSSNGSTSQGSVCGSTLALMDAGVPIKAPVAGISVGLIDEGNRFITMLDIQGLEDFFGDMDFKVAGTHKGITSIQVDIKNDGLTPEIIKEAFEKTRKGRIYILDEVILKAIDKPRESLSEFAPKIITTQIDPEKIRDIIGPGGKTIQKIIAETGVKIDIEDDGKIFITTSDSQAGKNALKIINGIANDPEIGEIYMGKVTRIFDYGAIVEFLPGKDGLVHISKLDHKRVNKVEDVVKVGDEVLVKVLEINKQGRIILSRKDAIPKE